MDGGCGEKIDSLLAAGLCFDGPATEGATEREEK